MKIDTLHSPDIPVSRLLRLAGPVMLSQMTIFLCGITDLIFIRSYGSLAISAVSIANILGVTLMNFMEGFGTVTTVHVSSFLAHNQKREAGRILSLALLVAVIIGSIICGFAGIISSRVFQVIDSGCYFGYGREYLCFWLAGFPIFLVFLVMSGYYRGIQDTMTPLKATLMIGVCNAILDSFLICGIGKFTGLGVPGSALSSLLSYLVGTGYLILKYLYSLHRQQGIPLQSPRQAPIKKFLRMFFEVGFYTGFMNIALCFFMGILNRFGPNALAAHQISFQIFLITYLPSTGFLVSATILVPGWEAKGKALQVMKGTSQLIKLSLGIACCTSLILELTAPFIARFFLLDNTIAIRSATHTLRIVGVIQLCTSVYMVLRGTLTALRKTRFIAVEGAVTGYCIFLPLAYLLAVTMQMGIVGGYLAFLCWAASDVLFLGIRWWYYSGLSLSELITVLRKNN